MLSDCSGSRTQPCSLQPLKEAISVLFSFTRRVLDDAQFQTDIHHWLERLVYTPSTFQRYFTVQIFYCCDFSCGSGPFCRWQSCWMSEGPESTCTCCVICCVVLLGLASGLHLSFRLVWDNSLSFVVRSLLYDWLLDLVDAGWCLFICSDPSLGEHQWRAELHASSSNLNVTCEVNIESHWIWNIVLFYCFMSSVFRESLKISRLTNGLSVLT